MRGGDGEHGLVGAWRRMVEAVRADHATMHRYDAKYAADRGDGDATLARDFVTRIGFGCTLIDASTPVVSALRTRAGGSASEAES